MDVSNRTDEDASKKTDEYDLEFDEARLSEEIKKMEYEPLLPIEKKLIMWSLILGTSLLGVFVWISYTFFPS
ncbi:MAG: hypothetical protein JJD96_07765 [Thermoleophilia bacterium]|nr:hypothetical protein [Thermoleophilia bacterium]